MTKRDYYTRDDTYGEAHILRCIATHDGYFDSELDATLFHPQGGGQPADKGWIGNVPVLSVFNDGETVWHRTSEPVATGPVAIRVDSELRALNARWHSAGHLIGYAGELHGWQPVKAHHWPGEGRITFTGNSVGAAPDASLIEAQISAWIAGSLPRKIEFIDGKREVRFGELPAYGCGGTHSQTTGEIGHVTLTSVKMKKGQLVVSYTLS